MPMISNPGPNIRVNTNAPKYFNLRGLMSFIFSLTITLQESPIITISPLEMESIVKDNPNIIRTIPTTSMPATLFSEYPT